MHLLLQHHRDSVVGHGDDFWMLHCERPDHPSPIVHVPGRLHFIGHPVHLHPESCKVSLGSQLGIGRASTHGTGNEWINQIQRIAKSMLLIQPCIQHMSASPQFFKPLHISFLLLPVRYRVFLYKFDALLSAELYLGLLVSELSTP